MKKLISKWSFKKHIIFCLLVTVIVKIARLLMPLARSSASIGIIGGADGPTAIFVSQKMSGYMLLNMMEIILFVLLLLLYKPIKDVIEKYSTK